MYNHNKAQQSKNRVHISWDILYIIQKWISFHGISVQKFTHVQGNDVLNQ